MDIIAPDAPPVKTGDDEPPPNPKLGRVLDAYLARLAACTATRKKLKSATGRKRRTLESAYAKQERALNAARDGLARGLAAVVRTAASCRDPLVAIVLHYLRRDPLEVLS